MRRGLNRRLTIRERMFLKEYLAGNAAGEAAARAYNCSSRNSARVIGCKILKRPQVRLALETVLDKRGLSDDYLAEELRRIIEGC